MFFNELCCFLAPHGRQRSGDDKGLACQALRLICQSNLALHAKPQCFEFVQKPLVLLICKKCTDMMHADLSQIGNCQQFLLRSASQGINGMEGLYHIPCRGTPDARDTKSGQELLWVVLLACLDCRKQFVRILFLSQQSARNEIVTGFLQTIDIRDILHISLLDELVDISKPEPLDIHRVAAHKVQDMVFHLRGAVRIRTFDIRSVFLALGRMSADRALRTDLIGNGTARSLFFDDCFYLWDDFAGFIDENGIAQADIQLINEVLIVQRGAFHRRSTKTDRIEDRRRRNAPCAPDGKLDASEYRLFLFRRVFIGNRPSGHLGRRA